jgi:hypothetical protein
LVEQCGDRHVCTRLEIRNDTPNVSANFGTDSEPDWDVLPQTVCVSGKNVKTTCEITCVM